MLSVKAELTLGCLRELFLALCSRKRDRLARGLLRIVEPSRFRIRGAKRCEDAWIGSFAQFSRAFSQRDRL
jgi:hypothetical protein